MSGLLLLPLELRREIYSLVLYSDYVLHRFSKKGLVNTSILRTDRQMNMEASSVFYATNTFWFPIPPIIAFSDFTIQRVCYTLNNAPYSSDLSFIRHVNLFIVEPSLGYNPWAQSPPTASLLDEALRRFFEESLLSVGDLRSLTINLPYCFGLRPGVGVSAFGSALAALLIDQRSDFN